MNANKSEIQLACELVKVLDGVAIEAAQNALARANSLLLKTQLVNAKSPLLAVVDENDATFKF